MMNVICFLILNVNNFLFYNYINIIIIGVVLLLIIIYYNKESFDTVTATIAKPTSKPTSTPIPAPTPKDAPTPAQAIQQPIQEIAVSAPTQVIPKLSLQNHIDRINMGLKSEFFSKGAIQITNLELYNISLDENTNNIEGDILLHFNKRNK